jgi:hypothetical protein
MFGEEFLNLAFLMQCDPKRALQWYSECRCVASVTKTFTLKGVQSIHLPTSPMMDIIAKFF